MVVVVEGERGDGLESEWAWPGFLRGAGARRLHAAARDMGTLRGAAGGEQAVSVLEGSAQSETLGWRCSV